MKGKLIRNYKNSKDKTASWIIGATVLLFKGKAINFTDSSKVNKLQTSMLRTKGGTD